MSILLTEEQELIGQSARDFAKEYLDPIAQDLDHTGQFPAAMVKQLAAQDFLGLFLPGEYGGAEAGFVSLVEVVENLSRSCAAVASILVNHSLAAYAIQRWGDAAQKQAFLPALAAGGTLGGFAVFEHGPTPGVGPDALIATRHPAGWALKGTKAFVRNAGAADVYVVLACTDPAAGAKAQAAFIVGAKAIGLTVGPLAETMGLKGCPVADLVFDDVVAGGFRAARRRRWPDPHHRDPRPGFPGGSRPDRGHRPGRRGARRRLLQDPRPVRPAHRQPAGHPDPAGGDRRGLPPGPPGPALRGQTHGRRPALPWWKPPWSSSSWPASAPRC